MRVLSAIRGYGLATICCGVALAVAWPIDAPSSCFLLAVTVSRLFGGLAPGIFSVALSAIPCDYFFLWRTSPPAHELATLLRFAVFMAAALVIAGLMEIKRRGEESRNCAGGVLRSAPVALPRITSV